VLKDKINKISLNGFFAVTGKFEEVTDEEIEQIIKAKLEEV